jgi:hypothetical protein
MRTKRRININNNDSNKKRKGRAISSPAPHGINQSRGKGAKGETREEITLVEANQPLTSLLNPNHPAREEIKLNKASSVHP